MLIRFKKKKRYYIWPQKANILYRNPTLGLKLFIFLILIIREFICFTNFFIYSYFVYNKLYFFLLVKRFVFCSFPHFFRLSFFYFWFIKNYKILRFFETSILNKFRFLKFRSNYFFKFNFCKHIYQFNNFFIKFPLYYLICLYRYLDHFRIFKYNEYLRRIPKAYVSLEINMHFRGCRYFTVKRFVSSFFKNRILIYYLKRNKRKLLRHRVLLFNKGTLLNTSKLFILNNIFFSKIYILFFRFFRRIFRLYFLYFCYIIYVWFFGYLRDFLVGSCRFPKLGYLRILNNIFHLPIWCILRRSFIKESFLTYYHITQNNNIYCILSLDLIPFHRIVKFYFLDQFSIYFRALYHIINKKYKNSKRRPRKFTARRQLFMLWFRIFISYYYFDFIPFKQLSCFNSFLFLRKYITLFTWSIFHRKRFSENFIDYLRYRMHLQVDTLLHNFRKYSFTISSLYFNKLIKKRKRKQLIYPAYFIKKIIFDLFYKINELLDFDFNYINKRIILNLIIFKEYKLIRFLFINILKPTKFWKYFIVNNFYYKNYYPSKYAPKKIYLEAYRILI